MAKSMVERARELRPIIEAAAQAGLDDDTAITAVELFPAWAIGVAYAVGARINYGGLLYKCAQAHTSQADWTLMRPLRCGYVWTILAKIGRSGDSQPERMTLTRRATR